MADVSVEFGAKDTGLEATLKTVQAEMSRLETEIKSGELSFNDLNTAMRDLAKADKVQNQLQGMAQATKEVAEAARAAEPKLNALGNEAAEMGNKVQGAGQKTGDSAGLFDAGFAKIAAAFTVGNLAAKGFEVIVNGVFSSARAVVDAFGDALDLGGRLSELSQRTGETAGNLLVLETAFKNSGLAGDQVGQVINKLQNFMQDAANGGEKQTATMNRLGISMQDLAGKTPTQQMEIFASKISSIEDPTQRAATASDVFGDKLGGKLLPLLSEFAPTLEDSREKVGSLADVMDENAATFDAAGETFDAVKGKLTALAAGILSETIPAFDELGTSVEQIDAASLGEEIGSVLNPALRELNSILIDAIREYKEYATVTKAAGEGNYEAATSTGEATGALDLLGTMVASVVGPISDLVNGTTTYIDASNRAAEAAKNGAASIDQVGVSAAGVTAPLGEAAAAADSVSTSVQAIDSGGAFASINEGATIFKSLVDEGNISLSDMSGEIGGQIPLQTEHVALVGELNTSLGEANEKAGEQLAKIDQQIAAEYARNEAIAKRQEKSTADYAMQLEINQALADGNKEEAKRLESIREHAQLTEKIMRDTGMTQEAAQTLASDLIESKSAASGLANEIYRSEANMLAAKKATTDTKTEVRTLGNLLAGIAEEKVEDPIKKLKEESKQAQTELKGISKILNVDITGGSPVDMMKKLGLDPNAITGSQNQLDAIKGAIDILKGADPADLTPKVDKVGVQDNIDAIQTYIQTKLGGTTTANIEATADKNAADNAAGVIKQEVGSINSNITTQTDDNNIASTRATIEQGVAGIPLTFTVDPEQIKKSIGTIDVTGGAGGGVLSSIETLVSTIQGYVETIRDRLPMTALA